ncbi:hypothetical protein [Allokutzneria multivorans]|uniref:hypothetical protein n=1 Tax=Allokutzneria multivorans TaxID=1142134 RepID=UPI0031E7FADF
MDVVALVSAKQAEDDAHDLWTKESKDTDHSDQSRLTACSLMLRRAIESMLSEHGVTAEFGGLCTEENDPQSQPVAMITMLFQGERAAVPVWPCVDRVTIYSAPENGSRLTGEPLALVGNGQRAWSTAQEWCADGRRPKADRKLSWVDATTWTERLIQLFQAA